MDGLAQPTKQGGPVTMPPGEDSSIGQEMSQEQASKQEQKMYEALVEPMLGMIHSPEHAPKIEEQIRSGKTIGEIAYGIGMAVIGQIEKQGKKVPLDVIEAAAESVIEDLVEIQVAMGVVPDEQDAIEQAYTEGLMEAAEMYGITQRQTGKMSPEENQAHFDESMKLGGFDKNKVSQAVEQGMANGQ